MEINLEGNNGAKHWYALYIKHHHEFRIKAKFDALDIENYLPVATKIKQWSDRKKKVTEPLLWGYIFIKATEKERLASLEVDFVFRCVSERGVAAKIPEYQIENMRNFIMDDTEYVVVQGLVAGSKVRIKSGPFEGVEGILIDNGNNNDFAVSIDLLNRTIVTKIEDPKLLEVVRNTPES